LLAHAHQIREFFSYKHFYVVYCKFWELDADHDLLINADELARYDSGALSRIATDRAVAGFGKKASVPQKMTYNEFICEHLPCLGKFPPAKCPTLSRNKLKIDIPPAVILVAGFILSEEDKTSPTAQEYWFRILDLDGDGVLSLYELERNFEGVTARLEQQAVHGIAPMDMVQFSDALCQMSVGLIAASFFSVLSLGFFFAFACSSLFFLLRHSGST
jgi:serine/threonine-protein phosphatase 2A regulatory subunit B''